MKKQGLTQTTSFFGLMTLIGLMAFAFTLLFSLKAKASHLVGGEISYQHQAGTTNDYVIILTLYRDCSGIPLTTSPFITVSSSCAPASMVMLTPVGTTQNITPVCALQSGNTTCSGGTLFGVEKQVYIGTTTLLPCSDWLMVYEDCCRNGAITNLSNPSSQGFWITATLDNSSAPNNSASFKFDSQFAIANGVTSNLNWGAVESDGDSLSYELIAARAGANGVPLAYNLPTSFLNPFVSFAPAVLSSATGDFAVSPNQLQLSVVCIKVSEYRTGQLIGTVTRDVQVYVINETNILPVLSGINGTSNTAINGCPGSPITFTINSFDADAGQQLTISENNPAFGSTVSYSTGLNPVTTFTWVPSVGDVSANPYVLTLKVQDDHCDYMGTQFYSYSIFVNGCNQNDVWPGDANADGIANLYDLIPIGIAFNDNGPVRTGASLSWVAQPASNWTNSFTSGVNHKHADCDGNGTVDLNDVAAITLNYGLTHPLRLQPASINTAIPDIALIANADTVGTSALVDFDIVLGSSTLPVDSIYGIAFKVNMNSTLIDTTQTSVTMLSSFMGIPGTDVLTLNKIFYGTGQTDIALCRNTQTNTGGYGVIGRIGIVITDNLSGKVAFNAGINNVFAIKFDGTIVPLNAIGDAVVIDPLLSVNNSIQGNFISVFPNPVSEYLFLKMNNGVTASQIQVTTLEGKVVKSITADLQSGYKLKTKDVPAGLYFVSVKMSDGSLYQTKVAITKK